MPYYRSYRKRYSPYRSWRRNSVYRAQANGTRRFSVSIPVSGQINVPCVNGLNVSQTFCFFPWAAYTDASGTLLVQQCCGNLFLNNLFLTYTTLYDEVKLNSFSVRLSVLSVPVDGKGAFVESCLDRHANVRDIEGMRPHAQIQNSSEVQNNQFTSLDRATVYRSYRARDIGERSNFFDCTYGDVVDPAHEQPQWGRRQIMDWAAGGGGNFSPALYFYIRLLSPPVDNSNVLISYQVLWNLTFRNPKASVGGSIRGLRMSDLKVDAMRDMVDDESQLNKKKVKFEEPVYEEEDVPDDDDEEMDSQKEPTREELLEMLAKLKEKG